MNFSDYEEAAAKTAIYPQSNRIIYPALGINGEAGEIAERVKKVIRDKGEVFSIDDKAALGKEIGDVLWYLTALAHDLGITLEQCAKVNVEKLRDRQERQKLGGSGDNR